MGNRSWLYLQAGDGDDARTIALAESTITFRCCGAYCSPTAARATRSPISACSAMPLTSDARAARTTQAPRRSSSRIRCRRRSGARAPVRCGRAASRRIDRGARRRARRSPVFRESRRVVVARRRRSNDYRIRNAILPRLWWQVVNCMDFRDVRGVRDALEIELPPDWARLGVGLPGSAACCITISFVRNRRARGVCRAVPMPAKCTATGSAAARSAFAHATGCGVCDVKPTMRGT